MSQKQDQPEMSRRTAPKQSVFPPPGATIPRSGGYERKSNVTPKDLKKAESKVLRVIVAMPILIVTSYYLYKRGMFQFLTRDYLFSWKWGWRNWNLDPPPKQLDHLIEEIYEKFGEVEHHEYEYLKNRAADANRSFWTTYSGFRRGKKTVP